MAVSRWLYAERGQAFASLCPCKLALNVGSYISIQLDLYQVTLLREASLLFTIIRNPLVLSNLDDISYYVYYNQSVINQI